MNDIIKVTNVSKAYGGVKANVDISFKVKKRINNGAYWSKWVWKNYAF
jgi:ABC-type branched-subunit amino acid transport system ATPase component